MQSSSSCWILLPQTAGKVGSCGRICLAEFRLETWGCYDFQSIRVWEIRAIICSREGFQTFRFLLKTLHLYEELFWQEALVRLGWSVFVASEDGHSGQNYWQVSHLLEGESSFDCKKRYLPRSLFDFTHGISFNVYPPPKIAVLPQNTPNFKLASWSEIEKTHQRKKIPQLVGGWTTLSEKICLKWVHLPQLSGWKWKNVWNHHLDMAFSAISCHLFWPSAQLQVSGSLRILSWPNGGFFLAGLTWDVRFFSHKTNGNIQNHLRIVPGNPNWWRFGRCVDLFLFSLFVVLNRRL